MPRCSAIQTRYQRARVGAEGRNLPSESAARFGSSVPPITSSTGQLSEPSGIEISSDKTVAIVSLSIKGKGTDAASNRSLEVLREQVVPATVVGVGPPA